MASIGRLSNKKKRGFVNPSFLLLRNGLISLITVEHLICVGGGDMWLLNAASDNCLVVIKLLLRE